MRTSSRALEATARRRGAWRSRSPRAAAPGAAASGSTTTTPAGSAATIASTMVLGGPPECPTRPYCQIGLEKTYGLNFKSFKPLDAGGPLTVAALKDGSIQVGLLFTTSGAIAATAGCC